MYRDDGYKCTAEEYYDWLDNICAEDFEQRYPEEAKAIRESVRKGKRMSNKKMWWVHYGTTSLGCYKTKREAMEFLERCRKDPDLLYHAAQRDWDLDALLKMRQYSENELW
jgi:hypothetical protein